MIGNVDGVLSIFKVDKATKPMEEILRTGNCGCTTHHNVIGNKLILVLYVAKVSY